MARKNKKRVQKQRRPAPAPAGTATAATASSAAAARPLGRPSGQESLVRSIEMSLAPRGAGPTARRGRPALAVDGVDPGIPLDRVPYFTGDLAKLLVVAIVMLVLLIAGSQLIPIVVK
jgi:hypothetical protein